MIKRTLSEHDLPEVREATEYFWHPDSPWHAQYHGPSYLFGRKRGDDPQLAKVLAWGRGRGLAQPKQPLRAGDVSHRFRRLDDTVGF